ncbi:hypothetical protein DY000_02046058 [Brassica cretica]|uniref:Zinc finger GRF-type domain-containing protein n=1 Tax=Brassica cretica TaxID=69181 RepID=A0ABQ7EUN9_BRACR|nr:hypothetical protein DY000_02046058 [Brassica cretica]
MGQDYSYNQPSSSDEYDIGLTCLLQAEVDMYADEAESSYNIAEPVQYPPQPEVATSYSRKDPGRRYFTCENVDDGDCHVCKWWDVAVMEEMSDFQTQLRQRKDQGNESEQKLAKLDKTVCELSKNKSGVTNGFELVVCLMEELQRLKTRVSVRLSRRTCEPIHGCIWSCESVLLFSTCEPSHGFFCFTLASISFSQACV